MSDTVRIRVFVSTSKVGSQCEAEMEFDADDWRNMTEDDREDAAQDAMWNMVEWGWEEV